MRSSAEILTDIAIQMISITAVFSVGFIRGIGNLFGVLIWHQHLVVYSSWGRSKVPKDHTVIWIIRSQVVGEWISDPRLNEHPIVLFLKNEHPIASIMHSDFDLYIKYPSIILNMKHHFELNASFWIDLPSHQTIDIKISEIISSKKYHRFEYVSKIISSEKNHRLR